MSSQNLCADLYTVHTGIWLSNFMWMGPQRGTWHNISWIPGFTQWVYVPLPNILSIDCPPQKCEPTIDVLEKHQKLAEIRKIWERDY